jgi:hypothetical protein
MRVVMVAARLLRNPHLCVRFVRMCVCCDPVVAFAFPLFLPSRLLACADHLMNLIVCIF